MNRILRMLEPRSGMGVFVRFAVFVSLIGLANAAFMAVYAGQSTPEIRFVIAHTVIVGGPFTAFFFFMLMQQVRLQRKLSALSRKDGLTGINNRRTFIEMTNRRRQTSPIGALFLLDADHFKKINDTCGHQTGDTCLETIAYALRRNLRENDVVGRIGGEEFAIFLCDATLVQARAIGERLTKPIAFQGPPDNPHLTVTLSVGVVIADETHELDELFNLADRALYRAKEEGRARVVVWNEMTERSDIKKAG